MKMFGTMFKPVFILLTTIFSIANSQDRFACSVPADIMFLLDGSSSISPDEWVLETKFVSRVIGRLDISRSKTNAGWVVFSDNVDAAMPFTPFKPRILLEALVGQLKQPTGIRTNTAAGLKLIRQIFRLQPLYRSHVPKIIIVITDGNSKEPRETLKEARRTKGEHIRVISVGVGNNMFRGELQRMASDRGKYYHVNTFSALTDAEKDIVDLICNVAVTSLTTVIPPIFNISTVPIPQNRICQVPGDIVFVIDGSYSIINQDFTILKNFVISLIENFDVGPESVHIGIVVYSTALGELINLQPPRDKDYLINKVSNLKQPRWGTDTAIGIAAARDMLKKQDRQGAPAVIVVITDGHSTYPTRTKIEASKAKGNGIKMMAVGVGKDLLDSELEFIASSRKLVSRVDTFAGLEKIVTVMRDLICKSR